MKEREDCGGLEGIPSASARELHPPRREPAPQKDPPGESLAHGRRSIIAPKAVLSPSACALPHSSARKAQQNRSAGISLPIVLRLTLFPVSQKAQQNRSAGISLSIVLRLIFFLGTEGAAKLPRRHLSAHCPAPYPLPRHGRRSKIAPKAVLSPSACALPHSSARKAQHSLPRGTPEPSFPRLLSLHIGQGATTITQK